MKHPFYVSGSIEIKKGAETFINLKRIALLKQIKELGSINAASKELKMSYQQAWHFIKEMNEISPLPLVVRQRGGSNGGGAELTKYGEKTLLEFEKLMVAYKEFNKNLTEKLWLCFF